MIEIVYNNAELRSYPIEASFKIIGKKGTVLIVRDKLCGTNQFNRFLENIEGISQRFPLDDCVNYKGWELLREE